MLALGIVGCTKAQDKKKVPEKPRNEEKVAEKPGKEKKVVYKGKTLEQWIEALKDKDEKVRKAAKEALEKIQKK